MMQPTKTFHLCTICGFLYASPGDKSEACPCGAGEMKRISKTRYAKESKMADKKFSEQIGITVLKAAIEMKALP